MRFRFGRRLVPWIPAGIALLSVSGLPAFAQETKPAQEPQVAQSPAPAPAPASAPTTPQPPAPAAVASPASGITREQLEQEVIQLKALVYELSGQMKAMSAATTAIATRAAEAEAARPTGPSNVLASRAGGTGAPGQSFPPFPAPDKRHDSPATLANLPGSVKFGPGFEIRTDDDEFSFQFHNLTQVDYRGYQQGGQSPVKDTFTLPRQWFMFSGRINKPIGYFVSLAHGVDAVSALDCFIDLNYDPRLNLRVGRFKTPFTYEFLIEPVQGLINPERSVFFNNFGQNRDVGVMGYGRLFDGYLDYALGAFDGNRNGYVANQNSKFVSAFVDARPFKNAEGSMFEYLNVGGSVFAGNANSPAEPQQLRTVVAIAGNAVNGIPFLTFNNNVVERGNQAFWDLHAAWFYQSLAIISEWQSGVKDYALTGSNTRTRVGVDSFYVQAGYLLTGETRSSVGIVKPLHPFDPRKGMRGPGAWELVSRVQYMDISNNVFTSGLVDPNNSANRLWATDLGFNWHMTQYMKVYFEWEHSDFNQPVVFAPGRRQLTSDMFLLRLQLFF